MKSGIFERFQSMPIARSSVLWAHVLTSLVANLISLGVVLLVALASQEDGSIAEKVRGHRRSSVIPAAVGRRVVIAGGIVVADNGKEDLLQRRLFLDSKMPLFRSTKSRNAV